MKFLFLVLILTINLFSQSKKVVLGEDEIRKSPATKFENRNEVYASPERKAKEIIIGKGLQNEVSGTDSSFTNYGFTIQRFYPDDNKLGGDILTINKNADYGHINSIRRILNAYIQSSFEYNEKNADKLVSQVLYYNAQNRKKVENISKRYTHTLIESLDKNKVGIGKKFSEWAGNTQIVIPIKSGNKTKEEVVIEKENSKVAKEIPAKDEIKSAKDFSKNAKENSKVAKEIPVKDEIKSAKDFSKNAKENSKVAKEIPDDTVDTTSKTAKNSKTTKSAKITEIISSPKTTIKEEKIIIENKPEENSKNPVKDSEKKEEPKVAKDSEKTEEPKSVKNSPSKEDVKIAKDSKTAKDSPAKEDGVKNTPPPEKDKVSEKKPDSPKNTNPPAKTNSTTTTSSSPSQTISIAKTTSQPTTTKKEEVKIPKTKDEIKKMSEELSKLKEKEKDRIENSDNVVGEKILFLKVKEFLAEGHYVSEMWAVDTENDDELFPSPFKKVCGKEFKELSSGVVVLSFKDNNTSKDTHHLALLDKNDLKLLKQTKEVVFWRTFLKEQNEKIYVVEEFEGNFYLSRFSKDLVFEKRSSDPINPDCEIAFKKNKIYMTVKSKDGKDVTIRVLDRDSLKLRDLVPKK